LLAEFARSWINPNDLTPLGPLLRLFPNLEKSGSKFEPRTYLSCARQSGLSFLRFVDMHAVICGMSGISLLQNLKASRSQAHRSLAMPKARHEPGNTTIMSDVIRAPIS